MFKNREEAGKKLALRLLKLNIHASYIFALPRGGVPVAAELSQFLSIPFTVLLSRKIPSPFNQELAVGAVAEKNVVILNKQLIKSYAITDKELAREVKEQQVEIEHRIDIFRNGKRLPDLHNQAVILVDDGIATGYTMLAAIQVLRILHAKKIYIIVPVCPEDTYEIISSLVDSVISLQIPTYLTAVGQYYQDFSQVNDQEVIEILRANSNPSHHIPVP